MSLHKFKSLIERSKFIEKIVGVSLSNLNKAFVDEELNVHCENVIGAVTIPVGIAGPLRIHGDTLEGEYYIPLATTEGALVASVNRGCKVIREAGGAVVTVNKAGTTRGPVFLTSAIKEHSQLNSWINAHELEIKTIAEATSHHLKYKKSDIKSVGQYTFVRFYFDTDDAMGMNMVTIATQKITELIQERTGIESLAVAGNFDIDKKPAWLNFINNRGFQASAEVVLQPALVERVLKVTPKRLHDIWLAKCMFGSAMSGSLGFNAHFANIIAAFNAATGQDLAHVVEGSMGITSALLQDDGSLYFSIYMPCLMLGTVGGGTKLKTQSEARSILKITHANELAQVAAGAVLAGELSLLASIAEGSLAKSHARLGR